MLLPDRRASHSRVPLLRRAGCAAGRGLLSGTYAPLSPGRRGMSRAYNNDAPNFRDTLPRSWLIKRASEQETP